jgi:hypothetical protein
MSEVVALFATRAEAERATEDLMARGHDPERVGYLDRHRDEDGNIVTDDTYVDNDEGDVLEEATKGALGGALGGAAVGTGAGLLASAGLLLIPGLGPFLAAGTLAGTLGAAAVGATGGGVLGGAAGAIFGAVDDNEHADEISGYYRERIGEGQALVSVDTEDAETMEVASLLRAAGAERVDVYGNDGWVE